jgi:hypothetical protein
MWILVYLHVTRVTWTYPAYGEIEGDEIRKEERKRRARGGEER